MDGMVELIVLCILGLAGYGLFSLVRDVRSKWSRQQVQRAGVTAALAMLGALAMLPGGRLLAQTDVPVQLEIDMGPLFTNINTYLPIMFGIFAVAGGITIAMVLAKFLINAIKGAFEGR